MTKQNHSSSMQDLKDLVCDILTHSKRIREIIRQEDYPKTLDRTAEYLYKEALSLKDKLYDLNEGKN